MNTAAGVVSQLQSEGHDMANLLTMAVDSCLNTVTGVGNNTWDKIAIGEWTTRDVVNHVTYEALWAKDLFEGKTIEQVGDAYEGDVVGDDPLGAFQSSVAAMKSVVSQPGSMARTTYISSGPTPGSEYAMQLFQDFLIHPGQLVPQFFQHFVDVLLQHIHPATDMENWMVYRRGARMTVQFLARLGGARTED